MGIVFDPALQKPWHVWLPLSKGLSALVSEQDYQEISQYKWCVTWSGGVKFYAMNRKLKYLHRYITKAPKGYFVDHIDGNGLNNTRENLRVVTPHENTLNRLQTIGAAGYRGVRRAGRKFQARFVDMEGKEINLGMFFTALEAAKAYDEAVVKARGEFAVTNFLKPHNGCLYTDEQRKSLHELIIPF